jgi:hypothetical protein
MIGLKHSERTEQKQTGGCEIEQSLHCSGGSPYPLVIHIVKQSDTHRDDDREEAIPKGAGGLVQILQELHGGFILETKNLLSMSYRNKEAEQVQGKSYCCNDPNTTPIRSRSMHIFPQNISTLLVPTKNLRKVHELVVWMLTIPTFRKGARITDSLSSFQIERNPPHSV